nr:immunoglobulin light chain junction region [Macaca mulatta]
CQQHSSWPQITF